MKFGKSFEQALEEENFPEEWVSASIQYKQLKKCINKVVKEMQSLGLNAPILNALVTGSGGASPLEQGHDKPAHLQYEFEGTTQHFQPKILLTIDDNVAVSAGLSPETRRVLTGLMKDRRPSEVKPVPKIVEITDEETETGTESGQVTDKEENEPIFETDEDLAQSERSREFTKHTQHEEAVDDSEEVEEGHHTTRTIEITLRADSEFFNLLTNELSSIDKIEAKQKQILTSQVQDLGNSVVKVSRPTNSKQSSDLYAWREIFALYRDAAVFFATTERDHGPRTAEQARQRIQWFQTQLAKTPNLRKFKNPESVKLLERFMNINKSILQAILFQQINSMATQKILKKFDKRTSLTARSTFPEFMSSDPFFAESLARAVCYVMSENLLSVLPNIDDYTCPVCASISFKPVRLECGHVFCIRCLVVLQRDKKSQCPICRREVVMKADSENIDESLLRFLKMYFPRETKVKQLENERAAGLDQLNAVGFGERQANSCVIS